MLGQSRFLGLRNSTSRAIRIHFRDKFLNYSACKFYKYEGAAVLLAWLANANFNLRKTNNKSSEPLQVK